MKTLNKVLLSSALVVLLPLGIFAQDKFEDKQDMTSSKNYKEFKKNKNHDGNHKKGKNNKHYLLSKAVNYTFEGTLESKPKDSLNGIWKISGTNVIVNDKTFIERSSKKIKIGDEIEVAAKRENGKITAILLEQEHSFFR